MKNALFIFLAAFAFTSCEVIVTDPDFDDRDAIVGPYHVEEYSETFNTYTNYSLQISKAGSGNDIYLENFYGADLRVRAELLSNKIIISRQMRDGYEIEGIGTLVGNSIQFNYRVKDTYYDTPTDFCETEAWQDW